MTIERLGTVDPVAKISKANKSGNAEQKIAKDSIAVSEEARRSAALQQTADIVNATPDIRMDRVAEVAMKLQDPDYINKAIVETVADNIMDSFGLS